MDDHDYKARKDDHLVEPLFSGLRREDAGDSDRSGRRGCFGLAVLLLLLGAFAL